MKHIEIDRGKWDQCISASPGSRPYAYSWYLDIMSPGWDALVRDNYKSVFPIPGFKKFGINYIATPVFIQRLGIFSSEKMQPEDLSEFFKKIPDYYRLIDLCIDQKIDDNSFKITTRDNFELDLSGSYDTIWNHFSSTCKKDIEKSQREVYEITGDVTPEELIKLFLSNKGKEIKGIKQINYNRLSTLMHYCISNRKGRIAGVRNTEKRLIFGKFIIETNGFITSLFIANTTESRENRIGYYVFNELIKEYSSTKTILDFEGSSIPSIATFNKSFGCFNNPYYRIYRNRLPWPLKYLK